MSTISTSLYLDKRNKKQDYIVKIRLTRDRKSEYIPIHEFRFQENEWDGRLCINRKDEKRVNAFLMARLNQVTTYIRELALSGKANELPLKTIKEKAELFIDSGRMEFEDHMTFGEVWNAFLEYKKDSRSLNTYIHRKSVLLSFCPDVDDIPINGFRRKFLEDYMEWLEKKGMTVNSICAYGALLTGIMKFAVKKEFLDTSPFNYAGLKRGTTRHRNVPVKVLREIFANGHKNQRHHDLFKMSFLLRGINFADLCNVTKDDIINGRLEYDRLKTGRHYSVKIEPEVYELMEKYPSKTRLLSFIEDQKYIKSTAANMYFKKNYGITYYHMRHSVGTIAGDLDIPLDHIALILGHKNLSRAVTLVYVNYDEKKADIAMRRIIDYVLYGKK